MPLQFFRGFIVGGLLTAVSTVPRKAYAHSHNYFSPNLKKQLYEKVLQDKEILNKEQREAIYKQLPWMKDRISKPELLEEIDKILKKFSKPVTQRDRMLIRTMIHSLIEQYKLKNGELDAMLLLLRYYKAI